MKAQRVPAKREPLAAVSKSASVRVPKAKKPEAALAAPLKSKGDNLKANNSATAKAPKEPNAFKGASSSHKKPVQSSPKMTQAEQSAEFKKVAREHSAEGNEEEFNGVLRKLVKPKSPQA